MAALTGLELIRELAMDQHGFVTTEQALDEGISSANLSMMVSRGRLQRVAHGVYRVPQVSRTDRDEYQLAVFWAGTPQACLSHETALSVRDLSDINPGKIHLTVPRTRRIRRSGGTRYVLHHEDLSPDEISWWEGIPVVTVRTAIRQCIESGVPTYLIKQALQASSGTSSLNSSETAKLRRMLKKRDDGTPTA